MEDHRASADGVGLIGRTAMKRKLLYAATVILVLTAAVGAYFWRLMNAPLYEPGMVRAGASLGAPLDPPAHGTDPDFWDVEQGIRLHHFAVGSGENVLIVHGGPGRPYAEPWPGLDALTGRYRFVYYDQRGSGGSTRPVDKFASSNFHANMTALDRALGLGAQIADIERIRRILGEEKLILIGHSFGGFLASLYASEFPDRVKALILVAPADVLVMPQEGRGFFAEIGDRLPHPMRDQYADFLKRYLDYGSIFAKSEADLVSLNAEFDPYYAAAAKARGYEMAVDGESGGGWMVHAMYFSMGRRHDYRSALKAIDAPVLVIHAAKDLQPEQATRIYVDAIPNAKLETIHDAGHVPFIDQPESFAAAIDRFLAEIR